MSLVSRALRPRGTRNAFAGAAGGRLNDFIFSSIQSPNQEVRGDLRTLRMRSRELCRNNPHAKRFLKLLAQNVIGPNGIRLESQVMLKTGPNAYQPNEDVNDLIEKAWLDWGRPQYCDAAKRKSWVSMQNLIVQTCARDGDVFWREIEGFKNDYGFAVQILDADQIDDSYTAEYRGNRIEMGVETDQYGAEVAYWMWTGHPSEPTRGRDRVRVSASEIKHLFVEERAGQVRGTPWLAPVLIALRMIAGYSEAEVVAARTAAAKMGFIIPGEDDAGPDPDATTTNSPMEATPGVIDRLNRGETFSAWSPDHPSGNFGPFMLDQLRGVSSGLNVAYTSLTGDLSSANYSSARVGLLDERDGWRSLQTWVIEHLHDPIYRRWLKTASLTSKLKLPGYDLEKYEVCAWRPRGWDWVDPLNDLQAAAIGIGLGLTTATEIAAARGTEFIDNMKARERELAQAEEHGVILTDAKGLPANQPPAPPPAPPEPAPVDEQAAADRQAMLAVSRSIDGAVKWQAQREPSAPVINVTTPPVTVDARSTHEAPTVNVTTPDIRVEGTVVNLPDVHVAAPVIPDIRIPDVILPAPIVNCAPILELPPAPKYRNKRVELVKNTKGVVTGMNVTEELVPEGKE